MILWVGSNALAEIPDGRVDFNQQIRPILTQYCTSCHGGVKQAGDVSFVYPEQVLPPDGWIVEPGDPEASVLIERIKSDDPDERMPPPDEHPDPLPDEKIALLEQWVSEGAKWGDHWSLAPLSEKRLTPQSTEPQEEVKSKFHRWPRRSLDTFVLSRLRQEGLKPSAAASPAEWLRRTMFDITGVPPSVEELESFQRECDDAHDRATVDAVYEKVVDRLLASKAYGERWASVWMDLARYADSKGFEKDPHRDMWPYRDWLIRAFNRDMPYDEFTIKQLAGDLLPDATGNDLIATAFHRNTQTNTEGGTDDEEFRVAAIVDRINTTWTVWQATTFGCVQCHSHPYDPYKQEEYYASMALFNNTLDADLDSDYPTLKIPQNANAIEAAVAVQIRYENARRERNRVGAELATKTDWTPLPPTSAQSTGGQLKIVGNSIRNAGGTFPVGVSYTIQSEAKLITAIRVEIRPESDDPSQWPEQGSVLSQLKLFAVDASGASTPIPLVDVYADAISGPDDPRSALEAKKPGVGGYPKLHGPRWAVFVLEKGWGPAPNTTLRFEVLQSNNVTGNIATPLRNFEFSTSNDERWSKLRETDEYRESNQRLDQVTEEFNAIRGVKLPVVGARPSAVERQTRLFIRGNWLEQGDRIGPGIPEAFQSDSQNEPQKVRDRLEFAQWLVSKQNPLAARVWVNRIWAQLFGVGLVETLEDFGTSGLQPTHPELLDHLAMQIRDVHGWRLKPLLKELVLSSTYRQTNAVTPTLQERDAENRLLARGPRTRLTAEMIRDQSLFVSGRMEYQLGGPSVMPPQPQGVWQTVYSGAKWNTAEGAGRYRRALYTYWRRTSPYPSFLMFDSPTRDICSARRIATNTPLQALVTLNDPVYVECAEGLVQRASQATDHGGVESTIKWMYVAATQRQPTDLDVAELRQLYEDLQTDSNDAAQVSDVSDLSESSSDSHGEVSAAEGDASGDSDATSDKRATGDTASGAEEHDNDASADSAFDQAAMTIVASTILNLDRALTK